MSFYDYINQQLCKKCAMKVLNIKKSDANRMVMTDYEDRCDKCGRTTILVDYIEDGD